MPKVSVIVPVYNVEKYLSKCLDSLINQTLEDIEIIVVNDGSSDNSQAIIDEYQYKYPTKIKSLYKENGGQGSARNEGLKISTGEFIGYVDSDDYVEPEMFEKMYNQAIKDNSDIVSIGFNIVSEDGTIIKKEIFKCGKSKATLNDTKELLFDRTAVCNKIYKAELLKNASVEFRCNKWYEDFDFTVKIAFLANTFSVIEEPLYNYLLRSGSTMNNSNVIKNLEILEAMDEIIKFAKERNLYEKYKNEIEYLAITHIYLPTNVRIIRANVSRKLKRETINKIIEYMNEKFYGYKKNKYINQNLSFKKKIILLLMNFKMYGIIELLFKLK